MQKSKYTVAVLCEMGKIDVVVVVIVCIRHLFLLLSMRCYCVVVAECVVGNKRNKSRFPCFCLRGCNKAMLSKGYCYICRRLIRMAEIHS